MEESLTEFSKDFLKDVSEATVRKSFASLCVKEGERERVYEAKTDSFQTDRKTDRQTGRRTYVHTQTRKCTDAHI